MKNLIVMTDFVLKQTQLYPDDLTSASFTQMLIAKFVKDCIAYANFLKKPLEKWMFVPCKLVDGVWVVLEKPDLTCKRPESNGNCQCGEESVKDCREWWNEYQQAKERCLFDGFEVVKDTYKSCEREFIYLPNTETQVWRKITFHTGEIQTFFFDYYEQFRTIEDLVKYNLQLTEKAKKQLEV